MLKLLKRIVNHYWPCQFVATHSDGLFWGCFRRISTYECFWSFYQPFSILASHLSTGSTKSALLMLPRQNKAQESSISLLRLQAATEPLQATDWERARAFVLEETSLAADKESCLGLLYSLLQNWDDTVSGSFLSYIIVSVCSFFILTSPVWTKIWFSGLVKANTH